MTCEEAIEFYKTLHERIVGHGGTDWFINVGVVPNESCNVDEVLEEIKKGKNPKKINLYRYYIRPASSSPVGPINPNNSL